MEGRQAGSGRPRRQVHGVRESLDELERQLGPSEQLEALRAVGEGLLARLGAAQVPLAEANVALDRRRAGIRAALQEGIDALRCIDVCRESKAATDELLSTVASAVLTRCPYYQLQKDPGVCGGKAGPEIGTEAFDGPRLSAAAFGSNVEEGALAAKEGHGNAPVYSNVYLANKPGAPIRAMSKPMIRRAS